MIPSAVPARRGRHGKGRGQYFSRQTLRPPPPVPSAKIRPAGGILRYPGISWGKGPMQGLLEWAGQAAGGPRRAIDTKIKGMV